MTQAFRDDPLLERLQSVLDTSDLSEPFDRWGAGLLAQLTRPVRIVVTGAARSGKTALIEMLSGHAALGQRPGVPSLELEYGPRARAILDLQDGSSETIEGFLRDHLLPPDLRSARQEIPDRGLLRRCFVEIGLSGACEQRSRQLRKAVAHADIVIWCTKDHDVEDHALWSSMPDRVKDQAAIVLSMADRHQMRGTLGTTIDVLRAFAAENFLGLYPVASLRGIAARAPGAPPDPTLWASCGGKTLADLLDRQIARGRDADRDQARAFLDQIETPAPMGGGDTANATSTRTQGGDKHSDMALIAALGDALSKEAGQLLADLDRSEVTDPAQVLRGCNDMMGRLSTLIEENAAAVPRDLRDDVEEASEIMMLLQLEHSDDAALDAATLLMQIKRELAERAAP